MSFGDTGGGTTTGTTNSSTGSGGFGGASYLDWLKFAASIYDSQKKGSFQNVPQTPQQTALYNFAANKVAGLPDATRAAYPIAFMGAASSPQLDMDKLRSGTAGAYTAPQRLSVADLASILNSQAPASTTAGASAPATTPAPITAPAQQPKLTKKQKINRVAKGVLGGAVNGLAGGPVGVIAGAVTGGLRARQQNKAKNKQIDANNAAAAAPSPFGTAPTGGGDLTQQILDWYNRNLGG